MRAMSHALPAADLVERGVADLRARRESVEALLVSTASSRLAAAGCAMPEPFADPELRMYELLARDDPDSAHGRYNALVRGLVSYARAAECVGR